jgi:uroporphyrinogen-III synthase
MTVLITRPQPDADAFAEMCRARELTPIVCPLMKVEALKCEFALSGVGALAFTSANGVRAFAMTCAERKLPVFTVGEGSAAVACAAGFEMVHAAGGDVDALAKLIGKYRHSFEGEVLHIVGTHRAGDLVAALTKAGVIARRKMLYEMRDADALPNEVIEALTTPTRIDWVALFSPRSVELLLSLADQAGIADAFAHMRAACLSEAVAQKARAINWKTVEIAAGRNVAAMIELIVSA